MTETIYDYTVTDMMGLPTTLEKYKDKNEESDNAESDKLSFSYSFS